MLAKYLISGLVVAGLGLATTGVFANDDYVIDSAMFKAKISAGSDELKIKGEAQADGVFGVTCANKENGVLIHLRKALKKGDNIKQECEGTITKAIGGPGNCHFGYMKAGDKKPTSLKLKKDD